MNNQGHKDFGTGYCCDTFYGMDMFTDDMTCYWCAYGDDWEASRDNSMPNYTVTINHIYEDIEEIHVEADDEMGT